MGHCAPSIAQTLLDVTGQKDWPVKMAAGTRRNAPRDLELELSDSRV